MSYDDAVFYYASGERADFPPADMYGLTSDEASVRSLEPIIIPATLPKFEPRY